MKAQTFKKYRYSQPIKQESGERRRKISNPSSLYNTQVKAGNLLTSGKSRHLSSNRNSHEDCKLVYQTTKDEHESKSMSKLNTLKSDGANSVILTTPYN